MRPVALAALAVAGLVGPAHAQTQPNPDPLPDLTPREFEIRGELEVSLPDLQRQPLTGFNPPPRTYVVPADRAPTVRPYATSLGELPENPLPEPLPPPIAGPGDGRLGRLDVTLGRYLARTARLDLAAAGLSADVDYAGLTSFTPDLPGAEEAPFNLLRGRVGFQSPGATRFGLDVEGDYASYRLFGAQAQNVTGSEPRPIREGTRIGAVARVEGTEAAPSPFLVEAGFERSRYGLPGLDADELARGEVRLHGRARAGLGPVRLDAAVSASGLDDDGLGASYLDFAGGGALRFRLGGAGELVLGARALFYDTGALNGGGDAFAVGPIVRFEAAVGRALRLFAHNRPDARSRSLHGLFSENPYAVPEPLLAPDLNPVDAEAGLEVQGEAFRARIFGGARWSTTALYFEQDPATRLFEAHYGEQLVARGGADVSVFAPGGLVVTAGAEGRYTRLVDLSAPVPYLAPFAAHLTFTAPFADRRGLVLLAGRLEGARPARLVGGARAEDAPVWGTLDFEGSYRVAGPLHLLLRAEHLLPTERWPGFEEPLGVVTAGIRLDW